MICSRCGAFLYHDTGWCPVCGSVDRGRTLRRWQHELQAPDPESRLAAVAALGRIGNPGAVDLLLGTLVRDGALDETGTCDGEAAEGVLRAIRHPGALRALLVLLATRKWLGKSLGRDRHTTLNGVQRVERALEQLFRDAVRGHAAKRQILLEGLADPDAQVRSTSAYYLRFYSEPRVTEALITALRDADAAVRERAAESLGALRAHRAIGALVEALADPDSLVASRAARALGAIGDPGAIAALLQTLQHSDDSLVRLFCEQALVAIGPPVLLPLLSALRKQAENAWFRHGAAQVLSHLPLKGDRGLRNELVDALESRASEIRVPLLADRYLTQLHEPGEELP
jgi:HEAT repeat protein